MSKLPQGWITTELGKIGRWCSGGTPSRRHPEYFGKGIHWVKSGDLPDGEIIETSESITEVGLISSSAKLMPEGTISMALYGATIGKLGIMTFPAATNQACANIIPDDHIVENKYVFFYLLSERQTFIDLGQGGAQPNISQEIVRKHTFPLPPLNEQRRIVAKLEEVLAKVNASQKRLTRIPVILKRFRQAVLAAACSGRLTADWREENPNTESSSVLIINKEFEITQFNDELLEIPDKWEWTGLGNYGKCSRGRFSVRPRNDPSCYGGEHPFIQIGNLPPDGGWIEAHSQTLNGKGLSVSKKFQYGTVVIAIVGATIGNTGLLSYEMCFPDSLVGIETGTLYGNKFVELYLRSRKDDLRQISYAGGGQPNIKLDTLNPYPLPLPPLSEQQEIVRRVESFFILADQLEARYQKAKTHVDKLTQSILAKAFRGELVPQDPNDEPASSLLERIRSQKKSVTPVRRKK